MPRGGAIRTAQVLVLALHIDDNTSASLCLLVGVVAEHSSEHWVSADEDGAVVTCAAFHP